MVLPGFTLILSSCSDRETSVLLNFKRGRPIDYRSSLTLTHTPSVRIHVELPRLRLNQSALNWIVLRFFFSATGAEFIVKERALMDDLSSARGLAGVQAPPALCFFENGPSTYSKDQLGYLLPWHPNFSSLILVYGRTNHEQNVLLCGSGRKRAH